MPTGSCFCGAIAYETDLKVNGAALCHCIDCKKMSGSAFSSNIITPKGEFKITKGTPKEYAKTVDAGHKVTNYFCGDCGTTLFRDSPTFGDNYILKAGSLDGHDTLNKLGKPGLELYVGERPSWISQVAGTEEKQAMS